MKIVICGGGTAGWLAALMIKKVQPDHEVTVVESSKIGIVGAGEGSTGYLTDIVQGNSWDYGCNEADFIRETGATVKLGIHHRDWRRVGHSYIGPIDGTVSASGTDTLMLYALANGLPIHTASYNGYLIEKSLSGFFDKEVGPLADTRSHAYHFDAHRVGQYFKRVCGDSVKTLDSEITKVNLKENGFIESLLLSTGQTVAGDFFLDCTGFRKLFMEPMQNHWVSYSKNLPVNTAMPFLMDYDSSEQIDPVTTAWAQKSGWMWQIPTQDRRGCGYVYCDQFTSDEQAQREIEQVLGKEVDPIRFLKFDTGRMNQHWVKNCLWIGLSAAFAEPLEATSIHSTIVQLHHFVFEYLQSTQAETVNPGSVSIYNRRIAKMYDDFKDFLVLHYVTERRDTEFWRWMATGETLTDRVRELLELQKTRSLFPCDFDQYYGSAGASLHNWVSSGLGHISLETARRTLKFYGKDRDAETNWIVHTHNMNNISSNVVDNTELIKNFDKYLMFRKRDHMIYV